MSGSCCGSDTKFDGVSQAYKRILWIVIGINASMFGIEIVAGFAAQSQALFADALDFLGDSLTYGISLLVIGKALHLRTKAALFKGFTLVVMGLWVLGSTCYRVFILSTPTAFIMGGIGALALVANLTSLMLLLKYRDGDANVRSVWLCSRNDAIGNVIVMIAASGVWATHSAWPDLLVAGIMALLFLTSAIQILRQAMAEIKTQQETALAE